MPWLQLKLATGADHVETLAELLTEQGALSVTYEDAADQPLFEPPPGETPLWQQMLVTGLFEATADLERIAAFVIQHVPGCELVRKEILEDKDWVREWMDRYQPMHFGAQLWVVPSHHAPPDPAAVNILLDPGLAFGTGTHPTTAMCLRWLAAHPPQDLDVIDYGSGSGILAIAAAKLGARAVIAVDNDPQALVATEANARHNQVHSYIRCQGIEASIIKPCNVLLANILAGPLQALAPRFAELVHPGGKIVLSGILAEQSGAVLASYTPWFSFSSPASQAEWVMLSGTRNS